MPSVQFTQLSDRGTITLPKPIRNQLNLSPTTNLLQITTQGNRVILEPVDAIPTSNLRSFSKDQISSWIKQDQLTPQQRSNATKNLPR